MNAIVKQPELWNSHDSSGRFVFVFAAHKMRAQKKVVIATLTAIDGAAPRELGTQMVVAEDGSFAGTISSGCLERAILAEAMDVIKDGKNRETRYGRGSQYMDIVLPCGSGIDILYTICAEATILEAEFKTSQRESFGVVFSRSGIFPLDKVEAYVGSAWYGARFIRRYNPSLRIVVSGLGAEVLFFSQLASTAGYEVQVLSPDQQTLASCAGIKSQLLSLSVPVNFELDAYTAFISLMHEREWDVALLRYVLGSNAFYVGAVGSRKTCSERLGMLKNEGVDESSLDRLRGSIGLIPSTRDIPALSISILAEVVQCWSEFLRQSR